MFRFPTILVARNWRALHGVSHLLIAEPRAAPWECRLGLPVPGCHCPWPSNVHRVTLYAWFMRLSIYNYQHTLELMEDVCQMHVWNTKGLRNIYMHPLFYTDQASANSSMTYCLQILSQYVCGLLHSSSSLWWLRPGPSTSTMNSATMGAQF
jgi:hypothetical protein